MSDTYVAPTQEQLTALVNQRNKLQELVTFALNNLDAKSWSGLLLDTSDAMAKECLEEHWIEMFCRELNGIGYKVDPAAFHALRVLPDKPKRSKRPAISGGQS